MSFGLQNRANNVMTEQRQEDITESVAPEAGAVPAGTDERVDDAELDASLSNAEAHLEKLKAATGGTDASHDPESDGVDHAAPEAGSGLGAETEATPAAPSSDQISMAAGEQEIPSDEMKSLDAALSDGAVDLIESAFASVDDVLDGVFDESQFSEPDHAVDENGGGSRLLPTRVPGPTAAEERDIPDDRSADRPGSTDSSDEHDAPGDAPMSAGEHAQSGPGRTFAEERELPKEGREFKEEAAAPRAGMSGGDEAALDGSDEADEQEPLVEENASALTMSTAMDSEAESDLDAQVPAPEARRRWSILAVLRRISLRAMEFISLPMKWLPPNMRSLVDWVALSLVFWVPIVWILVFVLARSS